LWDVRRTPPLQSSTNFASSYKKYARSGRKSYRIVSSQFHLWPPLSLASSRAGHSAPQPGLKPSVRIRIRSRRAFMIRSMLVPLWLRRVQLWLCTLSVETNVCAVPSQSCFRCCSLTVYPDPQTVSASAFYWKCPLPSLHGLSCTVSSHLNSVGCIVCKHLISYFCDIRLKRLNWHLLLCRNEASLITESQIRSLTTVTGVETIGRLRPC
jgi:hypothetical protein